MQCQHGSKVNKHGKKNLKTCLGLDEPLVFWRLASPFLLSTLVAAENPDAVKASGNR